MLRMDVDQMYGNFAKHRECHRRIVYKSARTASWGNLTAEDAFVAVSIKFVGLQQFFYNGAIRYVVDSLRHRFSCMVAHHTRIGTLSKQKRQGSEDNRFACARFARYDIESGVEIYIKFVNQGII